MYKTDTKLIFYCRNFVTFYNFYQIYIAFAGFGCNDQDIFLIQIREAIFRLYKINSQLSNHAQDFLMGDNVISEFLLNWLNSLIFLRHMPIYSSGGKSRSFCLIFLI